jgi:hypothetical protein
LDFPSLGLKGIDLQSSTLQAQLVLKGLHAPALPCEGERVEDVGHLAQHWLIFPETDYGHGFS